MVAKMMMSIYLYMVIVAGSIGGMLAFSDATNDADAVLIDASPTTTKQRTLITKYQVRE